MAKEKSPMVIVLIETKFSKEKLETIKKKLNFDNCFIKDNIGISNSRTKWNCYLKSMISYGNSGPNRNCFNMMTKMGSFFTVMQTKGKAPTRSIASRITLDL